jgi:spore maturation protein CgeB
MIKNFKTLLKKNSLIFDLNAKYKANKVKRQYNHILDFYENKIHQHSLQDLLKIKGFDSQWSLKFQDKKPKIFYLGTNELQDKSGFIQALKKVADVSLFYKEDKSYGQYGINQNPISSNRKRLFDLFSDLNDSGQLPDILLMQTWEWRIGLSTLLDLKSKYNDLKIINICMDDRHAFYNNGDPKTGSAGLIPALDLVLNAAEEVVDWYLKEQVPAFYFPEASSLSFYYPLDVEKEYDVGFVGGCYGIRKKIVNALLKNNVEIKAYGSGWDAGMLPLNQTNLFFNKCKIVLGVGTIGHTDNFYSLKLRDFDAPLSGACYVTHNNNDLNSLYKNNKEIVLCNNTEEYVTKIISLLSNPGKLKEIADNGHKRAVKDHTYENRFSELFSQLNIKLHG